MRERHTEGLKEGERETHRGLKEGQREGRLVGSPVLEATRDEAVLTESLALGEHSQPQSGHASINDGQIIPMECESMVVRFVHLCGV